MILYVYAQIHYMYYLLVVLGFFVFSLLGVYLHRLERVGT